VSEYNGPGIAFDVGGFDPMRIQPVRHELMAHPLLQLPKLVELARRLPTVRYHDDRAEPNTSFTDAPRTHRVDLPPHEVVANIENAHAWLALHNIQNDQEYRGLVDEVLDHLRPRVETRDPGMHHRAGWIFVTSPHALTPYHMDHEHNFILQVRGTKTINVWDPLDREVVTERSLELFHHDYSRELVVYQEEFQARAHVFDVKPGMGAYMPLTSPHLVKNGPDVSITVSFTYYTSETRRREMLHKVNHRLRSIGLQPRPVGSRPVVDSAKYHLVSRFDQAKRILSKVVGRKSRPIDVTYAE